MREAIMFPVSQANKQHELYLYKQGYASHLQYFKGIQKDTGIGLISYAKEIYFLNFLKSKAKLGNRSLISRSLRDNSRKL